MSDFKNDARDMAQHAKETLEPVISSIREKTSPTLDRMEQKANDAISAAKRSAKKLGDFLQQSTAPGLNIQNEFFDDLEAQAMDAKNAAQDKAAEMQRRLEEMMGGTKE